jgi:hypothetical protein
MVGRGALALAALLLVGLLGREVAAPATAQFQSAQNVPVFQAQVGPPPPGAGAPPIAIAVTPVTNNMIDMNRLGIPRAAGAPRLPRPATGTIGTSNAYLSIAPDLIPVSTTGAATVVASGFTPGETIDVYLDGGGPVSFSADSNGRLSFGLTSGSSPDTLTILATGRTSGQSAGSVARLVTGPTVPGLAMAPHAVNPNGSATLSGSIAGFPPSTTVTLARNGAVQGTFPTDSTGHASFLLNLPSLPDGSAI